jgi:phosphotransferase system IIB component
LRLEVKDPKEINEKTIKAIGAAGVLRQDNSIQIIIGPQVAYILDEMKAMVEGAEDKTSQKIKSDVKV